MTDRIRTLQVHLSQDTRDDDAEEIKKAIAMIKGVNRVENGDMVDIAEILRRNAALHDFITMQMDLISIALNSNEEKYKELKHFLATARWPVKAERW